MSIKEAEILIIGGGAIGILCALILENIKHNNKNHLLTMPNKNLIRFLFNIFTVQN